MGYMKIMEYIEVGLKVTLVTLVPALYYIEKKKQNRLKAEEDKKIAKEERDRALRNEYYATGSRLNNMEISKLKKEK